MEVKIDHEICGNCELCIEACPEVFELLEGDVTVFHAEVPRAFEADCLYAREICPQHAIELVHSKEVFRDVYY